MDRSLSQEFADALCVVDVLDNWPELFELGQGVWKVEMYVMYPDLDTSFVEMWAKRRKDGVQARATGKDLREWGFGEWRVEEEGRVKEVDREQDDGREQEGGYSGA